MTTLDFQLLYEFNAWANARTRQAVESLPEEQLYVDMKNSFGSIHGTLIHLCGAEDIWLQRLTATEPYKFMLAKDFPTYNSVKKKWSEVESGYAKFISTLTEQKLNEDLIFKTMKGDSVSQKVWMALQHLVNHSSYHRGQLTTLVRQSGGIPVSTDLIMFYRQKK